MTRNDPKENKLLDELRGDAPAGDGTFGFMDADDGTKIFYEYWTPRHVHADRAVVCYHGMAAHSRYFSLIADALTPHGIAVAVMDYRGHGLSEGLLGDLTDPAPIVADAKKFLKFARRLFPGIPLFTLGESMGGAVSILVNADPPEEISGMALLAPAVAPAYKVTGPQVLYGIPYALSFLVRPGARVIRVSGNEPGSMRNPLNIRYDQEDPLHLKYVSPRYILNVKSLVDQAREKGPESITAPALIFQGGMDNAVDHRATKKFFERLKSPDKTFKFYPDAPHCMISDPDVCVEMRAILRDWILSH